MNGAERIAAERRRQVEVKRYDEAHDDSEESGAGSGNLALAAACYAASSAGTVIRDRAGCDLWPWDERHDKRSVRRRGDQSIEARIRDLEKAGALCAAEIDRLERERGGS